KIPDGPLRHYRYRYLRKSSGGMRLLEIPKPRLKQIQQQILHGILDQIPPHAAAHAFCKGRSVVTYVAPHAGQQVILHLDLQDFFPSLGAGRVQALLRTIGYPDRIARLLTALCTHRARIDAFTTDVGEIFDPIDRRKYRERHLPQGAPTSPALANLCAWRLDVRLTALAARFGAAYTRYADDLLFSGGDELRRGMPRFRILVLAIAMDEGFAIQSRKTRVLLQSQSQQVAGVVLNEHPNPARHDFDQLKALLFNCVRHGPASQNRDQRAHFAQHLQGRIAYCSMINPQRGAKLQMLFEQIQWPNSGD
ncbi:MAG: reverse transcriptase family protein, partial [Planctomycetaceae bacterium]|nr:reverse transcriptase family protein [Planctomycetaceae bacterium]